ncbi:2-oxoacid:acceptor oxidoreductase family protein [Pyramidobacter piscolens]|uniref:2-oxoacid:acceptor oxidoreductase family protein n=1 Tax=Pyramidobacter piscolens TaxID=638849 RepID=UPI00248FE0D9|nr:2-oxoacid:acceptor oxidoreductase family protein [Pyramidobacter piscolens]
MAGFYKELIAAGFGGQGVMMLGQLIAYAGMDEGRNVSWIPSYGPEMRGGTANCSTVVSEEPVGSPIINKCDICVVFNQPSLAKFESSPRAGGVLVYNSDLVKYENPRKDIRVIPVPAEKLAAECGSPKTANIVLLGAAVAASGIISRESAQHVVEEKLGKKKPQFLPMNLKALQCGFEQADKA